MSEACGYLVVPPVFKIGEVESLGLAGSIPVRFRHATIGQEATVGESLDPRRSIPRTDTLLASAPFLAAAHTHGYAATRRAISTAQAQARAGAIRPDQVGVAALAALPDRASSLAPVINATGVVIHTNLGRAPLSVAAIDAIRDAAGYVDVEFDLASGARASRGRGALAALAEAVPEAESALVVNNGAAALILATTAFAAGREVVISRGELVEIGDGFRLTDLIESTGARLREVGTTNRTTLADYADALGPDTGCILKVHPSNFRIEGFTSSVTVDALARLAGPDTALIVDIGSGLLRADPLLPAEPAAADCLRAGAGVVTGSGDKLLGGPQAGVLLGRRDLLERLRRHPLARALRVDKLTLAALEATLLGDRPPVMSFLHADPESLRHTAIRLARMVGLDESAVVPSEGRVGGGGAPGLALPGWAVAIPPDGTARLRAGHPPVIARIERGRTLVDPRCVPSDQFDALAEALRAVLAEPVERPAAQPGTERAGTEHAGTEHAGTEPDR